MIILILLQYCIMCTCLSMSFILLVWFKFKCFKCLFVINILSVKLLVCKFFLSRVALNDTKTRLSLMTRHGSYWNNIIITRVATSFFSCQSSSRTPPYPFIYNIIVYMRFGMTYFKKKIIYYKVPENSKIEFEII